MGIVRRQSFWNLANNYAGVALGYLNKVLLFSVFLTRGQFGLVELLLSYMVISSELSQFGVSKIIIRFFPYFHENKKREGGFIFFVLLYALGGFLLFVLLLFAIKPWLLGANAENSPLLVRYFYYLIPLTFAQTSYKVFSSLSNALLSTVLPNFAFKIGLRIIQTVLILLLEFGPLDFEGFLQAYVLSFFFPGLITFLSILWKKRTRIALNFSFLRLRVVRLMIIYGSYSSLTDFAKMMVTKVDIIMIGMLVGEGHAGSYAIAVYIATLVLIPAQSINAVVVPLIAKRMKERNMEEVIQLYKKSSLNGLVVGGLFFAGIVATVGPFFELLSRHSSGLYAVLILGSAHVFNILTGPHRPIVINSKHFKVDLIGNLSLLVMVIVTNYLLIPPLEETGAALATMIAMVAYNAGMLIYVRYRFGFLPFSGKTPIALLWIALSVLVGWMMPEFVNPYADIALRAVAIGIFYFIGAYFLQLSPDLRKMADLAVDKLRKLLR